MRKISIITASALALTGIMGMPMTVQAATCQQGQVKVIVTNANNNNCNTQEIKDQLAQYGINLDDLLKNNCAPKASEAPKAPETPKVPETPKAPEAPKAPETPKAPEAPNAELSFQEQVVKLVNAERKKAGLSAVTLDTSVQSAAQVRAKESASSFSHTRPNGKNYSTALTEAGVKYKGSGENIAWGQKTPEEVMKGWMNSAGHKANILNANYTKIGVGYYQNSKGVNYWSQLFIY